MPASKPPWSSSAAARVPSAAAWLGASGALPFVALAALIAGDLAGARDFFGLALNAYAALILSFLGGVQWGLTIAHAGVDALWGRLLAAVAPSLVGWCALLLAPPAGQLLLAAAFLAVLAVDLRAHGQGLAPRWYGRLRWPLTVTVVLSLLLAAASATT